MYKTRFANDKVIVSLSSTALFLHFQKNLAAGRVLSNGPRLTARDSRLKKGGVASNVQHPLHFPTICR